MRFSAEKVDMLLVSNWHIWAILSLFSSELRELEYISIPIAS